MRLDKFLKAARLSKSRGLARELSEAGRLWLNDRPAKPSKEVKPGDVIRLELWHRYLTVRVLRFPQGGLSLIAARDCYEVVAEKAVAEEG